MLNRRKMLQAVAAGAGAALGTSLVPGRLMASPSRRGRTLKRVVFFMQNQGFDPKTCIPDGMASSGSLAKVKLPEPISALEPYKERLHIINGLHGKHTSPSHSAFFGALGGYRGGDGVPPSAATIDYELSKVLPQTLLPHLCIGMDSIENMTTKPTIATLSASGAGQPIFMYSNPNHLYQMLYGGISTGDIRLQHEARTNVLNQIEELAAAKGHSASDNGPSSVTGNTSKASGMSTGYVIASTRLPITCASSHPRWTSVIPIRSSKPTGTMCLLDLGISALTSGVTNTLTIGSGRGEIFGAWKGLGVEQQGHNLGHMKQPDNPIWIKIRQYNSRMLVQNDGSVWIACPEGSGTMMDHTLIVYTSNNADKQHTNGANWPVMLLGNFDGTFKTGCFTQLDGKRPINALYATLLRAAGQDCERFNMNDKLATKFDDSTGPLKELLV